MKRAVAAFVLSLLMGAAATARRPPSSPPVIQATDAIATRMRRTLGDEELMRLSEPKIWQFVTPEERSTLATDYWAFRVNVPVRVSVMRHVQQSSAPFWLAESGFRLTPLRVRNEEYEYEVWQREYPAGRVGLGINGFDKHRVHYFVCVRPVHRRDRLNLRPLIPAEQQLSVMRKGASIYHDWPDLVLTEVPIELEGDVLLPTIRGRAREAHLVGGFRKTPFPSSPRPDSVALTWPGDPRRTIAVQWRTSADVRSSAVRWRQAGTTEWHVASGRSELLRDTRILNDPAVRWHNTVLNGLKPGTAYEYCIASPGSSWTEPSRFRTAPSSAAPFDFIWLSDTHNRPDTRLLLSSAQHSYPDAAFCAITGDLVGTGQYRDDWDQFFAYTSEFARERPIVPAVGNHDTIDGLGADLYLTLFSLPRNGAPGLQPGRSYYFTYGEALFIVLDCTDDVSAQRPWLERVLRSDRSRWKFALFHFPPYALSRDYPEIEREWCTLFDRYHVDFVLSGHVHHLQRNRPLRGGRVVDRPSDGTIYMTTVAVGQGKTFDRAPEYAAIATEPGPPLYHAIRVEHHRVSVACHDATGKVWDRHIVEKE